MSEIGYYLGRYAIAQATGAVKSILLKIRLQGPQQAETHIIQDGSPRSSHELIAQPHELIPLQKPHEVMLHGACAEPSPSDSRARRQHSQCSLPSFPQTQPPANVHETKLQHVIQQWQYGREFQRER